MRGFHVTRVLGSAGRDEMSAFVDEVGRVRGVPAMSDHMRLDLLSAPDGGPAGLAARDDHDASVVGYGQASRGNGSWNLAVVVDPRRGDDATPIATALVGAVTREVAAAGGGPVHWWTAETDTDGAALAAATGFTPGRRLHCMRRGLPLEDRHLSAVAGLATVAFVPGRDEEEWLGVNNAAFAGHPEQGGWTRETLLARETEDWFDPSGFLLAREDGRLAGFCWTKTHPDGTGEIYAIAVHPAAASRGLGRGLTVAGLRHLGVAGASSAMLYVDADNSAACALYRSLGFGVAASECAWTRTVPGR